MFLYRPLVRVLLRSQQLPSLILLVIGFTLLAASPAIFAQSPQRELLRDGSFENVGGKTDWQKFEAGYEVDRQTHRNGDLSIRCDSVNTTV